MEHYLKKFFTGKNGHYVIVQKPNFILILWLVLSIGARLINGGVLGNLLPIFAFTALLIWASMEIFWGDSWFRRALGLVVAILAIWHKLG